MPDVNDTAADYYDFIYKDYIDDALTEKEINLIIGLIPKGGSVMDLGCGTGRHLIALAQQGVDVLGVDLSQGMLNVLLRKFSKAKVLKANIYDDDLIDGKFDLVILMWNAVMEIAKNDIELTKLFQKLKTLLNKNGKILIANNYSETKSPADALNFSFEVSHEGDDYKVSWSVLNYDAKQNTTECEEKIEKLDQNGEVTETIKANIQQKWWKKKELEEIGQVCDLLLEETFIPGSKYRYYVLSKKNETPQFAISDIV